MRYSVYQMSILFLFAKHSGQDSFRLGLRFYINLFRLIQQNKLLYRVIISHRRTFNDVVNSLVNDGERDNIPFLRLGDAGIDLKLYGIKQPMNQVFKRRGLDIRYLISLD